MGILSSGTPLVPKNQENHSGIISLGIQNSRKTWSAEELGVLGVSPRTFLFLSGNFLFKCGIPMDRMGIFPSSRTIPSAREDPSLPSYQEKSPFSLAARRQSSSREFLGSAQIPDSPALSCLSGLQIFPGKCGSRSRIGQEPIYPLWFIFPGFFGGGEAIFGLSSQTHPCSGT